MSLSKKNAEGYQDTTAYEALSAVRRDERKKEKREPAKVYICSPFKGDTETNVNNALTYCRFAVKQGKFPIAPHCYLPRFMNDGISAKRELAMSFGLRFLRGCRELWVFGDIVSDGMKRELEMARRRRIRIRRFTAGCKEVEQKC